MPKVAFHTLGCKVNFYDTEAIWQRFKQAGYEQVPFDNEADVYVVNTCTVTNTGDKKSRQMIRRAVRTNPDAVVAVTGCYAQVAPQEIAAIHGVDLVVGNDRKATIVDLVEQLNREQHPYDEPEPIQDVGRILKTRTFEEMDVPYFEERARANLKIQDGCNNFCTFCLIPFARGLNRSRKPENILFQARKLANAGYREIILTGIHTGGYGADLDGYRLSHLLEELERIDNLYRIRISSIEASEIDDHLIEVLSRSKKVCKHLHIPLQAGHDEVLKRMNRHYTAAEFAEKLRKVRAALPDLAITSDVIVGFPGETDAYYEETERFVQEQGFAQLHVFPYSIRKGTAASRFTDQVKEDVKEARVARMIAVSERLTATYAHEHLGKLVEVVTEEPYHAEGQAPGVGPNGAAGFWVVGHADNYLRVAYPLPSSVAGESLIGEVSAIRLTETGPTEQFGEFHHQVTFPELEEDAQ